MCFYNPEQVTFLRAHSAYLLFDFWTILGSTIVFWKQCGAGDRTSDLPQAANVCPVQMDLSLSPKNVLLCSFFLIHYCLYY